MDLAIIVLLGLVIVGIIFLLTTDYYLTKATEELKDELIRIGKTVRIDDIFNKDSTGSTNTRFEPFNELNDVFVRDDGEEE